MKSRLLSLAIGAALGLASSVTFADRDHDNQHYRDGGHGGYRGDYRVDEPRRWGDHDEHFRHDHYRPRWHHHWKHHVHDRWCGHFPPPARFTPRYLEPRRLSHEGWRYDNSGRITLIISSDLD